MATFNQELKSIFDRSPIFSVRRTIGAHSRNAIYSAATTRRGTNWAMLRVKRGRGRTACSLAPVHLCCQVVKVHRDARKARSTSNSWCFPRAMPCRIPPSSRIRRETLNRSVNRRNCCNASERPASAWTEEARRLNLCSGTEGWVSVSSIARRNRGNGIVGWASANSTGWTCLPDRFKEIEGEVSAILTGWTCWPGRCREIA